MTVLSSVFHVYNSINLRQGGGLITVYENDFNRKSRFTYYSSNVKKSKI